MSTISSTSPATPASAPDHFVNQSYFYRWRPSFHLIAPHGWLNDPCGPGYDPKTGLYHVAFQWNPNGPDWGDIAWGHSTSVDLVSWTTSNVPCLMPSASYDCKGVFTGCLRPTGVDGKQDGTLTYVYTSVSRLPIHYTIPYTPGCESLSIATSHDEGRTWIREHYNPILPGPPEELKVTGWRDPFITSWPLAPANIRQDNILYGFLSGGIVAKTPTVFVYAVNRDNLADWKYMGPLLNVGLNFRPSRWSGDFGVNWEVANVATLTDDEGTSRTFVIIGTEGCLPMVDTASNSKDKNNNAIARHKRIQRSQLWIGLKPKTTGTDSSSALSDYGFGGIFDGGLFYAANSFWDPLSKSRVVVGWITEEDLPDDLRHHQGWSGLISLPRVLKLITIHGVKRARSTTDLKKITSYEITADLNNTATYTIRTLGIVPHSNLRKLRDKAHETKLTNVLLTTLNEDTAIISKSKAFIPLSTSRCEVDAKIAVGKDSGRVGIIIYHSLDLDIKTLLYFDPVSETFIIERPQIPESTSINHGVESVPHTLFTQVSAGNKDGDYSQTELEAEEALHIRAFYDTSVLEVFVNSRSVLSTRIYLSGTSHNRLYGIYLFAEGLKNVTTFSSESSRLLSGSVWDGLAA
ncbi:glycosyl hydrolase [Lipomyces japonicus]|uniref:glycosyl hydrolase n=1 Tax=Lipomyces japonicus TaxID=56871 RepID=UPI0034CF981F